VIAVAFALAVIPLGCEGDEPDEIELSPQQQLDACAVSDPCTARITWDACAGPEGEPFQDQDTCALEALLADPPNVVRTTSIDPSCGDSSSGSRVDIYRWADGSMTCVVDNWFSDAFGGSSSDVTVRACSLPDPSTIEACLASAQAGEPASQTCLAFDAWGFELGEQIEPECRP
jgi:hypothetical protein